MAGSGPGYPFPEYTIEKVDNIQCLLPSKVEQIKDYPTCMTIMSQCKRSAIMRAHQRNDPHYFQYANWFDSFANEDKSVRTLDQDGDGDMHLWGGCKILLLTDPNNRNILWSNARESLRDQLLRYHTNQKSRFGGETPAPTVACHLRHNKAQCF